MIGQSKVTEASCLDHDLSFLSRLGISTSAERLRAEYVGKWGRGWSMCWTPYTCLMFDEAGIGEWVDED